MQKYTVLITGAGGTVGQMLMAHYSRQPDVNILALERSEQAMAKLVNLYGEHPSVKLHLADLLHPTSFQDIVNGCDAVVHCAALKHVLIGKRFPERQARENVDAFCNIFQWARLARVKKFLLCSTDKAATPTSVMGATKYLLERICISGSTENFCASAVRFANVIGSNGSLLPSIKAQLSEGRDVVLRNPQMTRYFMHQTDTVALIQFALENMVGGEVFTYDTPAALVKDVIEVVLDKMDMPTSRLKIATSETHENINERLVSPDEIGSVRKIGHFFVINGHDGESINELDKQRALSSAMAKLTKEQIKELLYAK